MCEFFFFRVAVSPTVHQLTLEWPTLGVLFSGTQSKPDLSVPSLWSFSAPRRAPDLTPKIAQLTFSICSYVWWWGTMTFTFAPLQYDPLLGASFSTQTIAQNRSQDQKCLLPEGATESILSISAPNSVFFFLSLSLCVPVSLSCSLTSNLLEHI